MLLVCAEQAALSARWLLMPRTKAGQARQREGV
jgi:hypothetical protein